MNITINYGSNNSITKSFAEGTTITQLLNDADLRGRLGYGTNVEAHIDGVPQPGGTTLRDGDVIKVHDKGCSKASIDHVSINANGGVEIVIEYGSGRRVTQEFPEGTTLEEVLADPDVRGSLGFGTNVEAHIDGVPQPGATKIVAGDEVKVHDKGCSKAA